MWGRFEFVEQRKTVCSADRMYVRDSDLQVEIPKVSQNEERRRLTIARLFKENQPQHARRHLSRYH